MAPAHFSLEGTIGAGKSTLLSAIFAIVQSGGAPYGWPRGDLVVAQEPVQEWSDSGLLQAYYADPARYAFAFQMYVLLTRMQQARALFSPTEAKAGALVVLTERCVASDCEVFARTSRESGMLDDVQWAVYSAWQRDALEKAAPTPPLAGVVYLRCSPETSARRIASRGRPGEASVDEACLLRLRRSHERWLTKLKAAGTPVLELDADTDGEAGIRSNARSALVFMAALRG